MKLTDDEARKLCRGRAIETLQMYEMDVFREGGEIGTGRTYEERVEILTTYFWNWRQQ